MYRVPLPVCLSNLWASKQLSTFILYILFLIFHVLLYYNINCDKNFNYHYHYRPPLDEIRSWSKSFDRLLKCPGN